MPFDMHEYPEREYEYDEHDEGQDDEHDVPAAVPGIELRIAINGEPVILADSLRLHSIAKLAGAGERDWYQLLYATIERARDGDGKVVPVLGLPQLTIQIRPVMLTEPPEGD